MNEAVHGGAADEWIVEDGLPLLKVPVRSNDGRRRLVPNADQLIQVVLLNRIKIIEPEIVEDKERDIGDAFKFALEGTVGTARPEPF